MTIARKNARDNAIPTNINTRTRVIAVGSGKGELENLQSLQILL